MFRCLFPASSPRSVRWARQRTVDELGAEDSVVGVGNIKRLRVDGQEDVGRRLRLLDEPLWRGPALACGIVSHARAKP
jgi:hypothetical protein